MPENSLLEKLLVPSKGFCESLLYGHPEYVNSYTALCILFSGLYGLYNLSNDVNISNIWRLLYSIFIINGIGSFGYHYTNYFIWKFIDEYTMLIAIFMGIYQGSQLLLYKFIMIDKQLSPKYYVIIMNIISIVIVILSTVFIAFLTVDIKSNNVVSSAFYFAVSNILLLVFIGKQYLYRKEMENNDEFKKLFRYINKTFIIALIAGIIWGTTEPFCDKIVFIQYLHTHAFWHITISITIYGFCIIGIFINYYNNGYKPILKFGIIPLYPSVIIHKKSL